MSNIKQFLDSASGKEMKDLLLAKYRELKSIDNIKDCETPTAQAIEIKANKKAAEKLRNILEVIVSIEEFNETSQEKDQYYSI